ESFVRQPAEVALRARTRHPAARTDRSPPLDAIQDRNDPPERHALSTTTATPRALGGGARGGRACQSTGGGAPCVPAAWAATRSSSAWSARASASAPSRGQTA